MFSRALLSLVACAALLGPLTGCSALTRPDDITIQAEPIGAPKPAAEGAAPAGQPPPNGAAMPAGGAG